MGDVKRYDPARYVEMRNVPGGPYVLHSDYSALLARHNALVEAVEWERECWQLDFWGVAYALCRRYPGNYIDAVRADIYAIRDAARAEVDRLIANETTADCKGEG